MRNPSGHPIYLCSWCLCACILLSGREAYAAAPASLPSTQPANRLLDFLVEQNLAARDKIRSYAYTSSVEVADERVRNAPGFPAAADVAFKGTAQVKREGDCLWCVYRRTGWNATSRKVEEREMRTVVNDKYTASWPDKGNLMAYRDDHASFDTISKRVQARTKIQTPPDFLPYCFGDREHSFRDSRRLLPAVRWDAIECKDSAGRIVYQIRRFLPLMNDPSKPDNVWTIDPDKGFLATSAVSYEANGAVWMRQSMTISEVSQGIWFPTAYEETRYAGPNGDKVLSRHQVRLSDVKVNLKFPREQFQIDALGLRQDMPNVIVYRTGIDGAKTSFVYSGDALVPQEARREVDGVIKRP